MACRFRVPLSLLCPDCLWTTWLMRRSVCHKNNPELNLLLPARTVRTCGAALRCTSFALHILWQTSAPRSACAYKTSSASHAKLLASNARWLLDFCMTKTVWEGLPAARLPKTAARFWPASGNAGNSPMLGLGLSKYSKTWWLAWPRSLSLLIRKWFFP